jgi:hypothetical protein
MIDVTWENLESLCDAAKLLPHRPHVSTLHRWRLRGIRGVRLETCLIGGRRFTSREAIERFMRAVSAEADGGAVAPHARTPTRRERDIQAAEAEMTKSEN